MFQAGLHFVEEGLLGSDRTCLGKVGSSMLFTFIEFIVTTGPIRLRLITECCLLVPLQFSFDCTLVLAV